MTKTIKVAKLSEDNLTLLTSGGLTKQQIALINSPTPQQWIKKRKGRGGKEFDYIPVGITIKVLNSCFGFGWSFEVVKEEILKDAKQVLVKGRLTVYVGEKTITKEQFASKEMQLYGVGNPRAGEYISIGDDLKGAASLCLTKCASLLGLFSDIYSSDFYSKWEMPDGEDVITTSDIVIDNTKAFDSLMERIGKLEVEKKKETAKKILETPPFTLDEKQKEVLNTIIGVVEARQNPT